MKARRAYPIVTSFSRTIEHHAAMTQLLNPMSARARGPTKTRLEAHHDQLEPGHGLDAQEVT